MNKNNPVAVNPVEQNSTSTNMLAADEINSAGDFRWLRKKLNLEEGLGENTEHEVETALLDHFQSHAPPMVLLVNVILAGSLAAVMWKWSNQTHLMVWFAIQSFVVIGNGFMYRFFQRRSECPVQHQNNYWYTFFCLGVLINGLSWGLAATWFYTPDAHQQSIFMILIVAGLSAGVTTVQSSLRAGFLLFITPALLLPAFLVPLRFGGSELTVTALVVLYYCAICYTGFNNHITIERNIRLKFEKDSLLSQIHSSEAYFRALIENATDLFLVVDMEGKIFYLSPSSKSLIGYMPDELTGLCLLDFLHAEDVHGFKSTLKYLNKYPGVGAGGEARVRHRNGHWVVLEGDGRTISLSADLIVINARDVSERRRMEAELRDAKVKAETANQAKSLFLANMSHEIRTPMHAILAMADILRETKLNIQQTRYVDAFKDAGEHLLSLLNDLLDFSRIETGELKLAKSPFHLPQFIESVFDLMWVQADSKGLTLHYDVGDEVRPWHLGDPQRLRQVIVNLVNNAIKFTDEGDVYINLVQLDDDYVQLEVRDTGDGIESDKIDLIFDSFQQADETVSDRHGGAGLGLAICKRLIEAMGGSIDVQSEEGVGTSFICKLMLPTTDEPSEFIDQRERDSALAVAKLPSSRILVADDSAMNRMVVEEFLRFTACEVDFASDGKEAFTKCQSAQYDLVLMDLRMPVMDGLAATRAIRAHEKENNKRSVPIVALTAGVSQDDKEKAEQAGCNDYLAKPVGKLELTSTLVKYLQASKKNQASGRVFSLTPNTQ